MRPAAVLVTLVAILGAKSLLAAPEASHEETTATSASPEVRRSLVKIFASSRLPDLFRPWSKLEPREVIGSGVVISDGRILTSNHVVSYASRILVQPDGSSDKLVAKVAASSYGTDLAVLTLEDPAFFNGHPPLPFGTAVPEVGQPVVVYGYAVGGDSVSVTKGTVSRIEEAELTRGRGLRIQVDAALNPGDSGGPALVGDKLVGLAFTREEKTDKTAYLIALEEITAFLDAVKAGDVRDRPRLPVNVQTLENPALRAKLGLDGETGGVMVLRPERDDFMLRPWDVLSAIGPHAIDNAGLTPVQPNLRLDYDYFVPKLVKDGKVPLTVVREAKPLKLDVPIDEGASRVLQPLAGAYPSYFILGPLTFSVAYLDHLFVLNKVEKIGLLPFIVRSSPLVARAFSLPAFDGEQLVLGPTRMFTHPIGKGYWLPPLPVLRSVNGTAVRNLKHLVELVRDSRDEYLVFEWADNYVETLVFRREELLKATDDVLADNDIRSQSSDDLKPVWSPP